MARRSRGLEKEFREMCLEHAWNLRHPGPDVWARAAEALGRLAQYAGIVVPALATGCGDPDVEVRSGCAHALAVIGEAIHRDAPGAVPYLAESVPALTAALGDGSAAVRRRAAHPRGGGAGGGGRGRRAAGAAGRPGPGDPPGRSSGPGVPRARPGRRRCRAGAVLPRGAAPAARKGPGAAAALTSRRGARRRRHREALPGIAWSRTGPADTPVRIPSNPGHRVRPGPEPQRLRGGGGSRGRATRGQRARQRGPVWRA